ncbi:type IV pilus modification PilV family protein [Amnibacterium endophyticum]|uniref:Prepilin-type N-terminal cleavage/methylation domain-containing protein n=1 Tax=Amnibacterium endophyticum TaxID=2109337 RepID=A0ABW4LE15_9MICO
MHQRRTASDEGLTLIEVMVAMLVFAILSTGIVAGLSTITRMTADDRARVTAQNLASREIDRMRALADPFKVMAATTAADRAGVAWTVDGRTYTVKRGVSWITQAGVDASCGGSSALFALRINVRVTWPGMLANTAPVQDDTLLAPTAGLSNDTTGGIVTSITDDQSAPQQGVGVTVKANTGGTTPAQQPADTDSEGCSYAGNLAPGNYDVTLSKNGWIDGNQDATPTKTVSVTKGATTVPQFAPYAKAASYRTAFQPRPAVASIPSGYSMQLPTSFDTTFMSGDNISVDSSAAQSKITPRYPYAAGYGVIAGRLQSPDGTKTCAAVDPAAWGAGKVGTTQLQSGAPQRATAYAASGDSTYAYVPMGAVLVTAPAGTYVGATQAPSAAGTPSCDVSSTYIYGFVSDGSPRLIGLPYGSWRIYAGTSVNNATLLGSGQLKIVTNDAPWAVGSDGTVVLDPRRRQ